MRVAISSCSCTTYAAYLPAHRTENRRETTTHAAQTETATTSAPAAAAAAAAAAASGATFNYTSFEGNAFRVQLPKSGEQGRWAAWQHRRPCCSGAAGDLRCCGGTNYARCKPIQTRLVHQQAGTCSRVLVHQPCAQLPTIPLPFAADVSILVDPWLVGKLTFGGLDFVYAGSKREWRQGW